MNPDKKFKQKVEIKKLEDGNVTIHVHDIYEKAPILNYTWTLQSLTPETIKELKKQLKNIK